MEHIEFIHTLLGLITILLFAIFIRLGSISIHMQNNQRVDNAYNDDHYKQRGELLQRQSEILEDLASDIQQLRSDVGDMKYVSDIFYKYRLPDKKEREMFDQIVIDNEVSDGIARARKKNT